MADWFWNSNLITSMNVIFVLIVVFGFFNFKKIDRVWIKGALIGAIPSFVIQTTLIYSRFQMMGADAAIGFAMGAFLALYSLVLVPVGAVVGYFIGRKSERKVPANSWRNKINSDIAWGVCFIIFALLLWFKFFVNAPSYYSESPLIVIIGFFMVVLFAGGGILICKEIFFLVYYGFKNGIRKHYGIEPIVRDVGTGKKE